MARAVGDAVRDVGTVAEVDGIHSIKGKVAAHTSGAANGVDVAEGEESIADAVGNVFNTADVADTTDLGASADGTITEGATGTQQKQRIGAVGAEAAGVGKVDTGFLRSGASGGRSRWPLASPLPWC